MLASSVYHSNSAQLRLEAVCITYPRQYCNPHMTARQQTLGFAPAPYKTRKARFLEEMGVFAGIWADEQAQEERRRRCHAR